MNALDLVPNSFDAVMSLDTLYWAVDLQAKMAKLVEAIKPGGQICVFMMQGPWDDDPPGQVLAEETELGQVLAGLGLRSRRTTTRQRTSRSGNVTIRRPSICSICLYPKAMALSHKV